MVCLIQPINGPYDPVMPFPTPMGFEIVSPPAFHPDADKLRRELVPLPKRMVPAATATIHVRGGLTMPDFFSIGAHDWYVSSRYRTVLEQYAPSQIEYIALERFNIPERMNPAASYYFINVLGRGQLIDWNRTPNTGPSGEKRYYFVKPPPTHWVMRRPRADDPVVWLETHKRTDDSIYAGNGFRVYVQNELGDALERAFPRQQSLIRITEA